MVVVPFSGCVVISGTSDSDSVVVSLSLATGPLNTINKFDIEINIFDRNIENET